MNWFGDSELQCCVMNDDDTYVIFTADCKGVLTILGDNWKERKRKAKLCNQAAAMRIAEIIVEEALGQKRAGVGVLMFHSETGKG